MQYIQRFLVSVKAQAIEVITKPIPLKKQRIVFNSSRNKRYNFNSKYLFEYFLNNFKDYEVYFVINDKELNKKLTDKIGPYFIDTTTLSGIIKASRAKVWVCSVINTPYHQLPIIRNKKRIVYHIGHGVPLKKIALAEESMSLVQYVNRRVLTYAFSHVLSYSKDFTPVMKKAFNNKRAEYICLGQPRNDALSNDKSYILRLIQERYHQINASAKLVLYAPTWRPYQTSKFFPFDDIIAEELNLALVENNTFLLLRQHPYFKFDIDDSFLKKSNILLFNADDFPEIMDYLAAFDKLITDYSSIYLDYLCMNKPISFLPYDLEKYRAKVGFSINYEDVTPGPIIYNKHQFIDFLISDIDSYVNERQEVTNLVNAKNIDNSKENAEFIISMVK